MGMNLSKLLEEMEQVDTKIKNSISKEKKEEFEKPAIFLGCGGCFGTQITCSSIKLF